MDEAADKQRLRAEARKSRAEAFAADPGGAAGERLVGHFLSAFPIPRGTVLGGYWPLGNEMDVRPLLTRLAAMEVTVALPVTRGPALPLEFRRWRPGDPMERGNYGIAEPTAGAPVVSPTVLLVPLLAFDAAGWRLGYGAGYYDRTLAGLRGQVLGPRITAVGIAYAAQELPDIPHHAGDQRLDAVVTEISVRHFTHDKQSA